MVLNSSMISINLTLRQLNGFKFSLKEHKNLHQETVTFFLALKIQFFYLGEVQEMLDQISLNTKLMKDDGEITFIQKVNDLLADFAMLEL